MDPDVASALFSPSKARQQQAQAKDWDYVTTWLRKKYFPKPIPNFERNEETLQALLDLAAFNERADEEQELIERVEREALKELQRKVSNNSKGKSIHRPLTQKTGLLAHRPRNLRSDIIQSYNYARLSSRLTSPRNGFALGTKL